MAVLEGKMALLIFGLIIFFLAYVPCYLFGSFRDELEEHNYPLAIDCEGILPFLS